MATRLDVDPKTVRRWLDGRLPYARHRWDLAQLLAADEAALWPELSAARAVRTRPAEMSAIYPSRSSISQDVWLNLFGSAGRAIDILVYSGLFLAENANLVDLLASKATGGVQVRIALGDPDSPYVAERGNQEAIGEAMAAKIRNAMILYLPLCSIDNVCMRTHQSVLYNSIYRADDQMLVNQHMYGVPAARAPVYHFRRIEGGDLFDRYVESFDRVWETGRALSA